MQVRFHEYEQREVLSINVGDQVVIVGYQKSCVTVRLAECQDYLKFLDECNKVAMKSSEARIVQRDAKVWAQFEDQWYRGKVDSVLSQIIYVKVLDLEMTLDIPKGNLRLLQDKELFFRPPYTRSFRMKNFRQKDVFSSVAVHNRMKQAIKNLEKFSVVDTANNYIDLQLDGLAKSFNLTLLNLYERQTGIEEPPPAAEAAVVKRKADEIRFTIDQITYPQYDERMEKPQLLVVDAGHDGVNWIIHAIHMNHAPKCKTVITLVNKVGKDLFQSTKPPATDYEDLEYNQVFLMKESDDSVFYIRCVYKTYESFEGLDNGKLYEQVPLERIRNLPRDLLVQSNLMVLLVDEDFVEDRDALKTRMDALKNGGKLSSIDEVIHVGGNNFKCIWKNP